MRSTTAVAALTALASPFAVTSVLADIGDLHVLPPVPVSLAAAADAYETPVVSALAPLSETFKLHSRPSATKVIYLDFNGHVTQDPGWEGGKTIVTPAFDPADNGAAFLDWELQRIQYIWQRVAEDFSPFDIDVTTEEPSIADLSRSGSGDNRWGVRVVIGDNNWTSPAGGLALMNSFTSSRDTPVFVFENGLANGNEKYVADAASHEVGHALGLAHDGRYPDEGYYGGHGSGNTSWGPIMGAPYGVNITQWSRGEYANANQLQDDLAIITSRNGFGYRPDDHGNTINTATVLDPLEDGQIFAAGVIETSTDRDLFRIDHAGGLLSVRADPFERGPNLDILLELLDANGNLLARSNPVTELWAQLAYNLLPGLYYLAIDGVGMGDPLTTGYSDYGSLGQYTLRGTIGVLVPEPAGFVTLASIALLTIRRRTRRHAT